MKANNAARFERGPQKVAAEASVDQLRTKWVQGGGDAKAQRIFAAFQGYAGSEVSGAMTFARGQKK